MKNNTFFSGCNNDSEYGKSPAPDINIAISSGNSETVWNELYCSFTAQLKGVSLLIIRKTYFEAKSYYGLT